MPLLLGNKPITLLLTDKLMWNLQRLLQQCFQWKSYSHYQLHSVHNSSAGFRYTYSHRFAYSTEIGHVVTTRTHDDYIGRLRGDYVVGMDVYVHEWDGRMVIGGK